MNKQGRFVTIFVATFLCANNLFAAITTQDSVFPLISYIRFGEEQGLTTKTVYSIIQDHEGFIWMGTDLGAFRYDGRKFKPFTTDDGLTDNEVLRIYEDRHHRIWFLTLNGHLSFWKEGKIYNPANTPFLKATYTGGTTRSVIEDKQGRLWFCTEFKTFIVVTGNEVQLIENNFGNEFIHEDAKGEIWYRGTWNAMYKVFDKIFSDSIYLSQNSWYKCFNSIDKNEIHYICNEGVFKIKDKEVTLCINSDLLPSLREIVSLTANGDTIDVCHARDGCYEYINGKISKKYLENTGVAIFYKDREGNRWFSVLNKGAYMLPAVNNMATSYTRSTGLAGEKVITLALGKNNTVWLGYNNGKVDCLSGRKRITYILPAPYTNSVFRITSLLVDSETTWCGTDEGTFFIHNEKAVFVPFFTADGKTGSIAVKRLFKGLDNKIYCTAHSGFMEVAKGKSCYYAERVNKPVRTFSGIEYKKNDFIVSAMAGLLEYIPGEKAVEYKTDVDFSSIRVLDMKADGESLVLATSDGIYIMRDRKIVQHIAKPAGLSDGNCQKIFLSGNRMYVPTGNGLDILVKKDNTWQVSEVKTIQDGLISNSINDVSADDENIYAATDDGLSVIKKTATISNLYVGRVSITELITDTTFMVSENTFSMKGSVPRLLIRFAYPVFNPVNAAKIKYRLLKNKEDNLSWNNSQNNAVEFSSLNPGNYIFQIAPDLKRNDDSTITSFYLNIEPLWWQTVPAKIIFSIVAIVVVVLFFVQRTKRRYELRVASLKQLNMLDKERNRIASDMHDDIGADLTQISMLANMIKGSKDAGGGLIETIADTSNEVLRKIDTIIWTLDSAHDKLPDLIYFIHEKILKYLDRTGIEFNFHTEGEIPDYKIDAIKRRNVFMVIKELAHNSVKYSGASRIEIRDYYENKQLHIIYTENGKGYAMNEITPGHGHTTMTRRMKEIDSTIDLKSGPGKGVTAHLVIPVY